jgi:hypothetical protein
MQVADVQRLRLFLVSLTSSSPLAAASNAVKVVGKPTASVLGLQLFATGLLSAGS